MSAMVSYYFIQIVQMTADVLKIRKNLVTVPQKSYSGSKKSIRMRKSQNNTFNIHKYWYCLISGRGSKTKTDIE